MSDLSKPNHYFHDNLGCPISCRGDHNHPKDEGDLNQGEHCRSCGEPEPLTDDPRFSGLPAAVVETAKKAKCTRCDVQIVEQGDEKMAGTVMVSYYVPALGVKQRGFLCGPCGLAFREFLVPSLETNPLYRAVVTELRSRWA